MNIIEVTKKALAENKCISRKSWDSRIAIMPTNEAGVNCVLISLDLLRCQSSRVGWQPSADDLIAQDWIIIELHG